MIDEGMWNRLLEQREELLAEVKRLNHELTDAIDNMNWLDELAGRKEEEVKRLREQLKRAYDWVNGAFFGNDSTMRDYTEYICGDD